MIEDMAAAFDNAFSLCAFNGVRFDIPFLVTAFSLDSARVSEWVFKTSDILEFSRLILSSTFSLDLPANTTTFKPSPRLGWRQCAWQPTGNGTGCGSTVPSTCVFWAIFTALGESEG